MTKKLDKIKEDVQNFNQIKDTMEAKGTSLEPQNIVSMKTACFSKSKTFGEVR